MVKNQMIDREKRKKIFLAGLSVLALLVIILWAIDLKNSLRSPSDYYANKNSGNNSVQCPDGNCGVSPSNNSKIDTTDTDKDGLSDREESEVYNTSPYLKDTDGDGINDKKEIEQGTDPNCPQGEECDNSIKEMEDKYKQNQISTSSLDSDLNKDLVQDQSQPQGQNNLTATSGEASAIEESLKALSEERAKRILEGNAKAEDVRKLLKNAGMDSQKLEQLSDDELLKLYNQSFKQQQNNTSS